MKLKIFVVLFILCLFNFSFSREYPHFKKEEMIKRGLKSADIIFYGKLTKVDTISGVYYFEIRELFKGNYNSKQIIATNNEEDFFMHPFEESFWIVYAKLNKDNSISLNLRSPTQTMEIPAGFPPPIPYYNLYGGKITEVDSLRTNIDNLKIKNETLSTFFYQLEELRAYKKSQNEISDKEKTETELETYYQYIIISLIVNIVLFLSLIFLIFKKKNFAK
ncbi:hypothetical protein SAMN05444671_4618 [Flavobacterium sp. CF108]|jgi:hypothetical protein|uniref:hypothetical protein n=1 Tax=unclassified Flavobacterium TaxID=196869 RepID=UPI0008D801A5|nr:MULTISPECIES: hypothetical protein [unclassified Flavobacterium]SEP02140.1 hypothetical protein SAMN04487978_4200 [Flavobacterium sp. fv08]SHH98720.1 hypothetical protein SAMN05444671_4618 [Flavobacterium sp. CF108]